MIRDEAEKSFESLVSLFRFPSPVLMLVSLFSFFVTDILIDQLSLDNNPEYQEEIIRQLGSGFASFSE